MRSDGLLTADWAVITDYIDVLKPLKAATKRLEGCGSDGRFGAIYEVIPVFECILSYYEQKLIDYEKVESDTHPEAPDDHLATNLRAAWTKANKYYSYAATMLYPYYKTYCDTAWAEKPDWLDVNNKAFRRYGVSIRVYKYDSHRGAQQSSYTTSTIQLRLL
jgi:hypothetical protein